MSMSEAEVKQLKKGDVITIDGVTEENGAPSLWRIVSVNHSQPGTYGNLRSDTHGSALLTSALLPRIKLYMASGEVEELDQAQALPPAEPAAETPTVPQGDGSEKSEPSPTGKAPAAPKRKRAKRA